MLDQTLIDLINSGKMWAFVGSGCSVGIFPTWNEFLDKATQACFSNGYLTEGDIEQIRSHTRSNDIPKAFTILKEKSPPLYIDSFVSELFGFSAQPTEITRILVKWPFESFITTNYDNLLESALLPFGGWVPIGNTANENSKISGDVKNIIWHPHGAAKLGNKNLRMVVASSDYDEIYPAGSPTLSTLQSIFRMKRILFIGFGFRDPDLLETLKRIGRFITPARPGYAFLANCDKKTIDAFYRDYKLNVISYEAVGNDHSDLLKILEAYSSFILDRNLSFENRASTPEYDVDTVGILTHNRLINKRWEENDDSMRCLTNGMLLAYLKLNNFLTYSQLQNCFSNGSCDKQLLKSNIDSLIERGIILKQSNGFLSLSNEGDSLAQMGKNDYELLRDQFHSSVEMRAVTICSDPSAIPFVVTVTVNYLKKLCMDQGLGVAQQLNETGELTNQARAVALLQGAKSELSNAKDRNTAFFAIKCLQAVLINPREEEVKYLGLLTQAYFGRHLLGADPSAIKVQQKNLSSTVFIADSNFIIPLLARGSDGNKHTYSLYKKLRMADCQIFTSDLLLTECVEHARWAWNHLVQHGETSHEVIDAARGVRGYKPNAFLMGYLMHPEFGPRVPFYNYFNCSVNAKGELPNEDRVSEYLIKKGIYIKPINEWHNFQDDLWFELEEIMKEIEKRRKNNGTFKHDRQVRAEAEVALIVTQVRNRKLSLTEKINTDAYFLSQSRVVDNLPNQANRICMKPESLFEWLLNIGEVGLEEARAIFDQLKWEISKGGVDIMPREKLLQLFHNIIDISKSKMESCLNEHREIIRSKYTESPDKAFLDIDPLDIPIVSKQLNDDVLKEMDKRLRDAIDAKNKAEVNAKSALKNKEEYERLKAEKKQRQEKAKRKARSSKSSKKKKKREK